MRRFFKQWRIGRIRIAIANVSIKVRKSRDDMTGWERGRIKNKILDASEWTCPICGRKMTEWREVELHHIIPLSMDPTRIKDKDNLICICRECHAHLHSNPFANVRLIAERFPELAMQYAMT